MKDIRPNDLRFVLSRVPKDVRDLLTRNQDIILAGGFIRAIVAGEEPKDIDLFGPSKDRLEQAFQWLKDQREGSRVHRTDNAITLIQVGRLPIQFITRWTFDNLVDAVRSFDFTVCQAGVRRGPNGWESSISDDFYIDLAARRLNYTTPRRDEDPGGSLMRVLKYLHRGYSIQAPSLAAVVNRLVSGVRGWDAMEPDFRTTVLTGLLRQVDPLIAIDGLEMTEDGEPAAFEPIAPPVV